MTDPKLSTNYEQLAAKELENATRSTDQATKRRYLDQAAVFATLAERQNLLRGDSLSND